MLDLTVGYAERINQNQAIEKHSRNGPFVSILGVTGALKDKRNRKGYRVD